MDIRVVFLIVLTTTQDVFGKKSFDSSVAQEIAQELSVIYPRWQEVDIIAINYFIESVSKVNQFVNIIESKHAEDNYIYCMKQSKESVKDVIKQAVIEYRNEHSKVMQDERDLWKTNFETMKFIVTTILVDDGKEEALRCVEMCEDKVTIFPKNLQNCLKCFDKLSLTEDLFTDSALGIVLTNLWQIYDRFYDIVENLKYVLSNLTDQIEDEISDLSEEIRNCLQDLKEEGITIKSSRVHTKESLGKYYQNVYAKVTKYLDDMKDDILARYGVTNNDLEEAFSDTAKVIFKGVQNLTSLRQEIIKKMNETEKLGDYFEHCLVGRADLAADILDVAFDGLEICGDEKENDEAIFRATQSSIETKFKEALEYNVEKLNDCVSEDYSPEGLSTSSGCVYMIDMGYRAEQDKFFDPVVTLVTLMNKDTLMGYQEDVRECTRVVLEGAEESKRLLVENIDNCVVEEVDEGEHDEL